MPINVEILKLEELSALLSSIKNDNDAINAISEAEEIINDLLLYNNTFDVKGNGKLAEIIKEFNSELNAFYDSKFSPFDNADSLYAFDKKYDVGIEVSKADFLLVNTSILLYILQAKLGDITYQRHAKKSICNILGRFLVLYYGSFNINIASIEKHPFHKTFSLALKCLALYDWSIDEATYLRLALLNLLDVLGSESKMVVKNAWTNICENYNKESQTINEHTCEIILQTFEKFYHSQSIGKIIEPLDTTWLYAYIYKQRFGYLFCKKISKSATNAFYPYTFKTTALCFKGLVDRVTGNSPKVVLFEKGVVRRSSEYRPTESNFLFNYTSMKFE